VVAVDLVAELLDPEIGRLLAQIEEERAASTIASKEEALDYARHNSGTVREDG
jgi:hypothetical protein